MQAMPDASQESTAAPGHRLRSGTAARLAGLPVTTLRVWERRYDVTAGGRTSSGQRVYSFDDVARLRLMRRLTNDGHAIGTIAALDVDALQALTNGIVGAGWQAVKGSRPPPWKIISVASARRRRTC